MYGIGSAAMVIVAGVAWMKPWKSKRDPTWESLIEQRGPDYEVLYRVLTIGEPSKVQQVSRQDFNFVVASTAHKNDKVKAGAFDALAYLSRNPAFQVEAWDKIRGMKTSENQNLAKSYLMTAMMAKLPEVKGELLTSQSSQDPQIATEASRLIEIGRKAKWLE